MRYLVLEDCLYNHVYTKKGTVVDVPDGGLVPHCFAPLDSPEAVIDEKPLIEKSHDGLEEMTRAQLIETANAEGVEIPYTARTKGDMINLIRRARV